MLSWRSEFFMHGHKMEDIDNLSYWDFANLTKYNSKKSELSSGKSTYKKISKSQQKMIEERKRKEGKK